jgi:hypothetical protein
MHGGGWDDTGRKIHRTHSAWRSNKNFSMRKFFKWKKLKFISTFHGKLEWQTRFWQFCKECHNQAQQ